MDKLLSASRFLKSEMAQFRLKVIEFSKEYGIIRKDGEYKGIKAATSAFGRSRTTIGRCEGGV
jgi:hypothetical protein